MKWEYKRILFPGDIAIDDNNRRTERKRYNRDGNIKNLDINDPVEDSLNELGEKGWELVSTTIVEGAQNSQSYKSRCIIEYILKREKQ